MTKPKNNPMDAFFYAIRSPLTKQRYVKNLDHFFRTIGMKGTLEEKAFSFIEQGKNNGNSWIFAHVMNYMSLHKKRVEKKEIQASSIKNYYKPIKLFLEMNDIEISWKKITRGLPKGRRFAADRAPTIDEIRKLVEYPDRRIKAILCTMSSSGIRVGAWDYLRWKDVIPIKRNNVIVAAKLIVYSEDPEQYESLITPEAYNELKKWMDYRESYGEKITNESWLMRDLWDVQKFSRGWITVPKKLKSSGVKRLIERALKAEGVRGKLPEGKRRHEFQTDHGFRKFFKTTAETKMNSLNVEKLMGHSIGISDHYYRPLEEDLVSDYLKAVPSLIISEEEKLRLENQKLEVFHKEETEKRFEKLEREIEEMNFRNQKIHDFHTVEKEKDPRKWAEKHLKFCSKYNLDPSFSYKLTVEVPEEARKAIKIFSSKWKKPQDL